MAMWSPQTQSTCRDRGTPNVQVGVGKSKQSFLVQPCTPAESYCDAEPQQEKQKRGLPVRHHNGSNLPRSSTSTCTNTLALQCTWHHGMQQASLPTLREVSNRGFVTSGPLARLCTMMSILPQSLSTCLATSATVNPFPDAAAYLLLLAT